MRSYLSKTETETIIINETRKETIRDSTIISPHELRKTGYLGFVLILISLNPLLQQMKDTFKHTVNYDMIYHPNKH